MPGIIFRLNIRSTAGSQFNYIFSDLLHRRYNTTIAATTAFNSNIGMIHRRCCRFMDGGSLVQETGHWNRSRVISLFLAKLLTLILPMYLIIIIK